MENSKKIRPIALQLGMTILILETCKIDETYQERFTRLVPEFVDVKDILIKKLELTEEGGEELIIINKGLGQGSEMKFPMDYNDIFLDESAAYEKAKIMNDTLYARVKDIRTAYEEEAIRLQEFEEFYTTQLSKTNLTN